MKIILTAILALAMILGAVPAHTTGIVTIHNYGNGQTRTCGGGPLEETYEQHVVPADGGGTVTECYGDPINGFVPHFEYEGPDGTTLARFDDLKVTHYPKFTEQYWVFTFAGGAGTSTQPCRWGYKGACYLTDYGVSTFPL
jgi:hypothetical protein